MAKVSGVNRYNLIFISVTRLHYGADGRLRSYNPMMSVEEWGPFLKIFDHITILARIDQHDTSDKGFIVDHPRFTVVPIPHYDGGADFLRKRRRIIQFVSRYIVDKHAVYSIWVPNPIALEVAQRVRRLGAPLISRVIGDSFDVSQAILPRPIAKVGSLLAKIRAQRAVQLSDGVVYVTLRSLQERYSAAANVPTLARTDIKFTPEILELSQDAIAKKHKRHRYSLIAVGSQQQNYKGHDLLIEAVARLQRRGYDLALTLIGTGRLHDQLRRLAASKSLENITFLERVGTSYDVARHVSQHDLFVMPSRTEGMPKALLEAMTVGVLSIGSSVGGIPEVLEDECLFSPGSVPELEKKIQLMLEDKGLASHQRNQQAKMIDLIREHHSGPDVMVTFLEEFVERVTNTK